MSDQTAQHWELAAEFAAEFGASKGLDFAEYMGAAYIGIERASARSTAREYLFRAAWNEMLQALIADQRGTRSEHYRPAAEFQDCADADPAAVDLHVDWEALTTHQWEAVRGMATAKSKAAHGRALGVQDAAVIKRLRRAQRTGRVRPH